jgi:hypothetical protein
MTQHLDVSALGLWWIEAPTSPPPPWFRSVSSRRHARRDAHAGAGGGSDGAGVKQSSSGSGSGRFGCRHRNKHPDGFTFIGLDDWCRLRYSTYSCAVLEPGRSVTGRLEGVLRFTEVTEVTEHRKMEKNV